MADVYRLKTCCRNTQIASAKLLWLHVLDRDVLSRHLPLPACSRPIADLSGVETKLLVTHALRLHQAHCSRDTNGFVVKTSLDQVLPVTWLQIISGSWLLAAMSDATLSTLMLFSIKAITEDSKAKPVAQCFLDGPVSSGLVEVAEDNTVIIALDLRSPMQILH